MDLVCGVSKAPTSPLARRTVVAATSRRGFGTPNRSASRRAADPSHSGPSSVDLVALRLPWRGREHVVAERGESINHLVDCLAVEVQMNGQRLDQSRGGVGGGRLSRTLRRSPARVFAGLRAVGQRESSARSAGDSEVLLGSFSQSSRSGRRARSLKEKITQGEFGAKKAPRAGEAMPSPPGCFPSC